VNEWFFNINVAQIKLKTISWNHKCLVFIFRILESTVSYADGLSNDVIVFIVPVLINDVNLFWMALSTYRSEMSNIRFKCLLRFSLFSSDISQRCNVETSETNNSLNLVTNFKEAQHRKLANVKKVAMSKHLKQIILLINLGQNVTTLKLRRLTCITFKDRK